MQALSVHIYFFRSTVSELKVWLCRKSTDTIRLMLWIFQSWRSLICDNRWFCSKGVSLEDFFGYVFVCSASWNKTASNSQRSKCIGIRITEILTDKKVIGLLGRGESITLPQREIYIYIYIYAACLVKVVQQLSTNNPCLKLRAIMIM